MKPFRTLCSLFLLAWLILGQTMATPVTAQPVKSDLAVEVPPENPDWLLKTVDGHTLFSVGELSSHDSHSFALDSSGHAHMVYGQDRLYYAYYNGSSWAIETIDPYPGGVNHASIVLDSGNNPHVSYCREGGTSNYQPLMYAYKNSGQWVNVTVDSSSDACGATSIGIDSLGNLQVAYFRPGPGEIRIAYKAPAFRWSTSTLLASGLTDFLSDHLNLVIGSDNLAQVSYFQYTGTKLYYRKEGAASWDAAQLVSDNISLDGFNSMALDSSNQPHISYVDASGLEYASQTGTNWSSVLARASQTDEYFKENSLVLDSANLPHIAYHRFIYVGTARYEFVSFSCEADGEVGWSSGDVANLATIASFYVNLDLTPGNSARVVYLSFPNLVYASEGSPWSSQTLDTTRWMDQQTSLALDSGDRARISYYDVGNADLKYAAQTASGWDLRTLDSSGDVGKYSAISIGPDDLPNVAYYDATHGDLKLTYDDGGGWPVVTIDSSGDVGQAVAMKSDSAGHLHLSYYDASNHRLKYAYYDYLSAPVIENVDLNVGTNKTSALVLSENNKPYIAYYNQSLGTLNMAVKEGVSWQIISFDFTMGTNASGEGIALARVPGGFMLAYGLQKGYPSPIKARTCSYMVIGTAGYLNCSTAITIDASAYPENGISMAAAPNGKAYIAYNSETSETMKVVTCLGGACSLPEIPDPTTLMNGRYSCMALSRSQQPRISYIDVVFKSVKLAVHKEMTYLPAVRR